MVWPMIVGGLLSAYGASKSASAAKENAQTQADAQQSAIWGPQQGYLTDIYGRARGLADTQGAAGTDWFNQIGQGAQSAFQGLAAGPQNPYLTGMADAAMGAVGRQFQSQIMPALLGGGNAAGQLGGGRYGMLQAQAAGEGARALGDVAQNIYGNAWESGMQGQLGALSALPGLASFGNASMAAPWNSLQQYSSLIGAPVKGSGLAFGAGGLGAGGGAGVNPFSSVLGSLLGNAGVAGYGGGNDTGWSGSGDRYGRGLDSPEFGMPQEGGAFGGLGSALGGLGLGGLFGL